MTKTTTCEQSSLSVANTWKKKPRIAKGKRVSKIQFLSNGGQKHTFRVFCPFWKLIKLIPEESEINIWNIVQSFNKEAKTFRLGGQDMVFTKDDLDKIFGVTAGGTNKIVVERDRCAYYDFHLKGSVCVMALPYWIMENFEISTSANNSPVLLCQKWDLRNMRSFTKSASITCLVDSRVMPKMQLDHTCDSGQYVCSFLDNKRARVESGDNNKILHCQALSNIVMNAHVELLTLNYNPNRGRKLNKFNSTSWTPSSERNRHAARQVTKMISSLRYPGRVSRLQALPPAHLKRSSSITAGDVDLRSQSFKVQKIYEDEDIDIISNLPVDVLHYIISFLPTRAAIRSSVLSKRWKYLWTSISNIDLEDEINWNMEFDKRILRRLVFARTIRPELRDRDDIFQMNEPDTYFLEFVGRVLNLHDDSKIKRLRLRLCMPEKYPDLNLWLQVAVNHNVEELDLTLRCKVQNALPCCLFTCHSLAVLKISAELTISPPPFTSFLNLKKLSLQSVTFLDDLSTQRLFSNCPVLDELVLKSCTLKHKENFTISIPTLKSLTLDFVYGCLIKISSINLTYLQFSSDSTLDMCLSELPSLDSVYLDIMFPIVPVDGFVYRARRLFVEIYNVKVMKISYEVFLSIICGSDILDHIPTFFKLIHLSIEGVDFPCYNELMKFLMKTPKLEHLDLLQSIHNEEAYEMLEVVPSCFNSSLKTISISFCKGTRAEMELLAFVLRKASALQRMVIYCSSLGLMPKYKETLSMLPKASQSCVIEIL